MTSSSPINLASLVEIQQNSEQRRLTMVHPLQQNSSDTDVRAGNCPKYCIGMAVDEIETTRLRVRMEETAQFQLKEKQIEQEDRLAKVKRHDLFDKAHVKEMKKLRCWTKNFLKKEKGVKIKATKLKRQRWQEFNARQTALQKKV